MIMSTKDHQIMKLIRCHYNFSMFSHLARSVFWWHAQRVLLLIASINFGRLNIIRVKVKWAETRKRDTGESIFGQKSGPALAVLPDRRRRPWFTYLLHQGGSYIIVVLWSIFWGFRSGSNKKSEVFILGKYICFWVYFLLYIHAKQLR